MIDQLYDASFYQQHEPFRDDYDAIAIWIAENLKPTTAIDYGCGNAFILAGLMKRGLTKAIGVEASLAGVDAAKRTLAEAVTAGMAFYGTTEFEVIDADFVAEGYTSGNYGFRALDLAICTEVAEHIEARFTVALVSELTLSAKRHIFFSAAQPGQPGRFHVNCQPPRYWIEHFKDYNWGIDTALTQKFAFEIVGKLKTARWFEQNVMIFSQ